MFLMSCLSTGMALRKMTGRGGARSLSLASAIIPVCMSHLAPSMNRPCTYAPGSEMKSYKILQSMNISRSFPKLAIGLLWKWKFQNSSSRWFSSTQNTVISQTLIFKEKLVQIIGSKMQPEDQRPCKRSPEICFIYQ